MSSALPEILFDYSYIQSIQFKGAGGQEKVLYNMFASKDVKRVNHRYYDFEVEGHQVEAKRQQGEQWFDFGKYYNMSVETGNVIMLFILHQKGEITKIVAIRLKTFIDMVCADEECQKHGWTQEVMENAYRLKIKYPSLEHKAKLNIKKLTERYVDMFKIYYEKRVHA
jgi:hypothetical protein